MQRNLAALIHPTTADAHFFSAYWKESFFTGFVILVMLFSMDWTNSGELVMSRFNESWIEESILFGIFQFFEMNRFISEESILWRFFYVYLPIPNFSCETYVNAQIVVQLLLQSALYTEGISHFHISFNIFCKKSLVKLNCSWNSQYWFNSSIGSLRLRLARAL